jgi:TonB family protein
MFDSRPMAGDAPRRERQLARTGLACLSSLAAHALLLVVLQAAGALHLFGQARPWAVALKPVAPAEWEANRGLAGALPPAQRPATPRQVIALPPDAARDPAREERPPPRDTRFLAARDQTVEEETVSSHAAMSSRLLRVPQDRARGRAGSGERGKEKIAVPGRQGLRGGGGRDADAAAPRPPLHDELAAAPSDPPTPPAAAPEDLPPTESAVPSDGEGGQRIEGRRISGMPLREYPRPEGGPDLDGQGLEEGPETRLHARRFAPAAFWTDVRARIMSDWEKRALVLLQAYDPLEDTYFYKPRTVLVGLTLDPLGTLREVKVLESSRLDFYDAIAIEAVREMQPYPHPPPSAIGPDGGASINVRFTWLPSDRKRTLR